MPRAQPPAVQFALPDNYRRAMVIKDAKTLKFPPIPGWTEDPARKLRGFQEQGIAWAYLAERGIIADQTGLGKTIQILGLVQLLAYRQERHRTIVVTLKGTQSQWYGETLAYTDLQPAMARGPKGDRVATYNSSKWDVLITTYPLMLRDAEYIKRAMIKGNIGMIVFDEGSSFRHHDIQTKTKAEMLSRGVPRILILDATPIQNSLLDLHSELEVLHMNVFGPVTAFERRYVRRQPVKIKRGERLISSTKIVGYKEMDEFRARIDPFVIRRRATDPEVLAGLPPIIKNDIWLDLPAAQREIYDRARQGIATYYEEGKKQEFRAGFHHLRYACDSTLPFGQNPPVSVKIDKIIAQITGDFEDDKVIVFSQFKAPLRHLMARLRDARVPFTVYTGDQSQAERDQAVQSFNSPHGARVMLGTAALERGLNLQVASHLCCLNMLYNPARMTQLAGRIQRMGSKHVHVFMHNYLTLDTIEERAYRLLAERNAASDFVFGEQSEIFDKLSDDQLYELMRPAA